MSRRNYRVEWQETIGNHAIHLYIAQVTVESNITLKVEGTLMKQLDELKLKYIISLLENMEYGSLNITVHAGEITQIDKTEKKRFTLAKINKS